MQPIRVVYKDPLDNIAVTIEAYQSTVVDSIPTASPEVIEAGRALLRSALEKAASDFGYALSGVMVNDPNAVPDNFHIVFAGLKAITDLIGASMEPYLHDEMDNADLN